MIKYMRPLLILLLALQFTHAQESRQYLRLKTGIHFDSSVSGGRYTLGELATIISRSDLDAAIITDHDNMKVSYGLTPFQKYLKYTINLNSVSTYGFERYLFEIEQYDKLYPDVLIMPGIEAVPFYYWEGSALNENLYLKDWHTHLLVFGLSNTEAYKNLPSLANGIGYHKPSGEIMKYIAKYYTYYLLIILYAVLFLVSFFSIIRKKKRMRDIAHIRRGLRKYRFSFLSLLFAVLFAYLLRNEYPFLPPLYDQYSGSQGVGPYQTLIDYVNQHDGLVFWAHPEVEHKETIPVKIPLLSQDINLLTEAYPNMVVQSNGYTGYAIFWEGMKIVGHPGGLWDLVLNEYCRGIRSKPAYAIGELDFEESNNLELLDETNTFVFAESKTSPAVLDALKAGRMYATRNFLGDKVTLDDFSAYDTRTKSSAFMGETLENSSGNISMHFRLTAIKPLSRPLSVKLYRNKQLVKRYSFSTTLDEWFADGKGSGDKVYYYRLIIEEDSWPVLSTNPVFISKMD